tara:strand:- start:145 stop:558 length:414 start_codon:yes stop_codon:yes gene_type:complete
MVQLGDLFNLKKEVSKKNVIENRNLSELMKKYRLSFKEIFKISTDLKIKIKSNIFSEINLKDYDKLSQHLKNIDLNLSDEKKENKHIINWEKEAKICYENNDLAGYVRLVRKNLNNYTLSILDVKKYIEENIISEGS